MMIKTDSQKAADAMDEALRQLVSIASKFGKSSQNWRSVALGLELVRNGLLPEIDEDDTK